MTARPLDVVVDGTDGAGKTHAVHFIVERLRQLGWKVASFAPYREHEVYPLWESEPAEAAAIITQAMDRFRSACAAEVIVWDRGWPTAFISTTDLGARRAFEPAPLATVLLLSTEERTCHKARASRLSGEWVTNDALVRRYNAAYHRLEAFDDQPLLRAFPDSEARFDFEPFSSWVQARLETAPRW